MENYSIETIETMKELRLERMKAQKPCRLPEAARSVSGLDVFACLRDGY
jgi:hypothetical protein